jgi:hypothetical protein
MDEGMNGGAPIQRPLSARQRETTTRRFRLIFEVGGGRPFLEIEGKKGGSSIVLASSLVHAALPCFEELNAPQAA